MNEEVKPKKSSTIVTVLITLLVVALIGCISFIVYDKVIKKNNTSNQTTNEVKNLDINGSEIKKLTFPFKIGDYIGPGLEIVPFDFNVSEMNRNQKMTIVANLTKYNYYDIYDVEKMYLINGEPYNTYIEQSDMKSMYDKIFGVDNSDYNDDTIQLVYRGMDCPSVPNLYDKSTNRYWSYSACGQEREYDFYTKIYKAEQNNDEIYVYIKTFVRYYDLDNFTYKYYNYSDLNPTNDGYKTPIDDNGLSINKQIYEINNVNEINDIEKIISESENKILSEYDLDTYKFTFKKQSDGNYYVYSEEWQ